MSAVGRPALTTAALKRGSVPTPPASSSDHVRGIERSPLDIQPHTVSSSPPQRASREETHTASCGHGGEPMGTGAGKDCSGGVHHAQGRRRARVPRVRARVFPKECGKTAKTLDDKTLRRSVTAARSCCDLRCERGRNPCPRSLTWGFFVCVER